MTTDRELMRRTWEFFSHYILVNEMAQERLDAEAETILEALRARLAQPEQPDWSKAGFGKPQPEQEPVAWHEPESYSNVTIHKKWAKENGWLPLYTAPPQGKGKNT